MGVMRQAPSQRHDMSKRIRLYFHTEFRQATVDNLPQLGRKHPLDFYLLKAPRYRFMILDQARDRIGNANNYDSCACRAVRKVLDCVRYQHSSVFVPKLIELIQNYYRDDVQGKSDKLINHIVRINLVRISRRQIFAINRQPTKDLTPNFGKIVGWMAIDRNAVQRPRAAKKSRRECVCERGFTNSPLTIKNGVPSALHDRFDHLVDLIGSPSQ